MLQDNYESELESVRNGCFASDLKLSSLEKQLPLLVDVAKQGFVRKYHVLDQEHPLE